MGSSFPASAQVTIARSTRTATNVLVRDWIDRIDDKIIPAIEQAICSLFCKAPPHCFAIRAIEKTRQIRCFRMPNGIRRREPDDWYYWRNFVDGQGEFTDPQPSQYQRSRATLLNRPQQERRKRDGARSVETIKHDRRIIIMRTKSGNCSPQIKLKIRFPFIFFMPKYLHGIYRCQ